jgi:hypothetical protein
MISTALIWMVWDFYLYINKLPTMSDLITGFSMYSPILPFILGVLIGHWTWPTYIRKD